ncbi:MAG TPA: SCO family protein [Acidobacteriaceae bacterium]
MHRRPTLRIASALVLLAFGFSLASRQGRAQQYSAEKPLGASAQQLPSFLKQSGISQNLNQRLPLEDSFRDSDGREVALGSYFKERPVVLALVYYKCRLLCPQVLNGMATALREVGFTAGKQYDVIVASIDPNDAPSDAAAEKQRFLGWLGDPGAASSLHFLTGTQTSIHDLAQATGFHYVQVPGPDGKMDQYAHSSVIMIATPDGRMSKYLSGIEYQPRDVRLAVIEASNRHIAKASDLILIYCCNYSPAAGKYTVSVLRVMSLAAMGSVFMLGLMIYLLSRKPKSTPRPA